MDETPRREPLHPALRITAPWVASLAVLDLSLFALTGLRFDAVTKTMLLGVVLLAVVFAGIGCFYRYRRPDPCLSDTSFAAAIVLLATQLAGLFSVVAVYHAPPLIDEQLAAIDAALGFHVPSISHFVLGIPWLYAIVFWSYQFFAPQIFLSVVTLGIALRDREALWTYVLCYCFVATVTIACFGIVQAEGATTFYPDYPRNLMLDRYIDAYHAIRSGVFAELGRDHLQGFVTFPSFHAGSGFVALMAFRGHPWLWWPLLVINLGLVAGTVVVGGHFVVDSMASLVVCGIALQAARRVRA